ncbi:hypothetical protein N476_05720 [Pseudoalteromonas luteoviolacea H33]|uniref:Uncharacterized protein n=1 Tax=Pseudoalteromonas luteoviolacea H33 TaxID=1365251 RepID=A0A166ZNC7_9GAMM|nr:hypothetical protein N476_05720 [Pseudoalteromonas luteoviolacea H33]KZN78511.1 hypothetical protein N477_08910 [Pseudoalteromonas luteoviolacea H33-S]
MASDKWHFREEIRTVYTLDATLLDKGVRQDWAAIKAIIAVERVRTKGKKPVLIYIMTYAHQQITLLYQAQFDSIG